MPVVSCLGRYSISYSTCHVHISQWPLIIALPLLVTVFGNIGWLGFLFSRRRSLSDRVDLSSGVYRTFLNPPCLSARLRCGRPTAQIKRHYSSEPAATSVRGPFSAATAERSYRSLFALMIEADQSQFIHFSQALM